MPDTSVKISVIIPAYNAAATLPECLRALQNQTTARSLYEIIVVDDGSTDQTAQLARQANVRVVSQPNQGPAAARNCGVSVAHGEFILFTDADCAPATDWIEQMVKPFNDLTVMGVKGVYRTRQKEWLARFVQAEYEDKYARMTRQSSIDFIDTYSAAYRRGVFTEGGLDSSFPHHSVEDIEFSFRLAAKGYRLVFAPRAYVYHFHPASLQPYLWRKLRYGYWRVGLYRLYPSKLKGDSHTAPELKFQLATLSLLYLSGPLALWHSMFNGLLAANLILFIGTMLPFVLRTWKNDKIIALLSPGIILARDAALLIGLSMGLSSQLWKRLSATEPIHESPPRVLPE